MAMAVTSVPSLPAERRAVHCSGVSHPHQPASRRSGRVRWPVRPKPALSRAPPSFLHRTCRPPTAAGAADTASRAPGHSLRLYIDSASRADWEELWDAGIFYAMTTNPVLLERAGVPCRLPVLRDLAAAAFDLGAQEFQLQTWGADKEEMLRTGKEIAELDPRIVVKVPITHQGARVTMTGVYTAHQALSAASIGAEYAAPYLGRICNKLGSKEAGIDQCVKMQRITDEAARCHMRILVASIKDADDMATLAAQGMDTFTFSPVVARQMLNVPDTIEAAGSFEDAAARMSSI